MAVSFEITKACELSVENLDFGDAPQGTTVLLYSETQITITCPDQLNYSIGITMGLNPSSGYRHLSNSSAATTTRYQLFQQPISGDGIPVAWLDDSHRKHAIGTGTAQTHTVYGELHVPSRLPTGDYTDTVTVRIYL